MRAPFFVGIKLQKCTEEKYFKKVTFLKIKKSLPVLLNSWNQISSEKVEGNETRKLLPTCPVWFHTDSHLKIKTEINHENLNYLKLIKKFIWLNCTASMKISQPYETDSKWKFWCFLPFCSYLLLYRSHVIK